MSLRVLNEEFIQIVSPAQSNRSDLTSFNWTLAFEERKIKTIQNNRGLQHGKRNTIANFSHELVCWSQNFANFILIFWALSHPSWVFNVWGHLAHRKSLQKGRGSTVSTGAILTTRPFILPASKLRELMRKCRVKLFVFRDSCAFHDILQFDR
jgi:hypothetical protein